MTHSAIAVRIINALEAAADREGGAKTALVSVTIDMLAPADVGAIEVSLTRKTRTLAFLTADFVGEGGARIATASSVHRLTGG
jgi:hypothetical protein